MIVPATAKIFEGELASYWFDPDGILTSLSRSVNRTIRNTAENFDLVRRITNHQKACLLVYLNQYSMPGKETRKFVTEELPTVYKAMALVSKSNFGKRILNVLFKIRKPSIPVKTFTNDNEARQWLKQFL